MNDLIQALTRAANAVAVYYEQEALNPIKAAQRAVAPTIAEAPVEQQKIRKTRTPKAEALTAPVTPSNDGYDKPLPTTKAAAKDMSEDDSVLEIRNVAKTYAKRFANQLDGVAAFRKIMADTCKVGKMDDLVHAQRLQLIGVVKAEIAKADRTTAPSLVGAGAGVEV